MADDGPEAAARTLADLVPQLARLIAGAVETLPDAPLTLRQYRLLEYLRQRPFRTTELALVSDVTQPTASAALAALEARGLVQRVPDPQDRRASRIVTTPAGDTMYDLARQRVLERLALITEDVTPADSEALLRLRPVLVAGMDRARQVIRGAQASPRRPRP